MYNLVLYRHRCKVLVDLSDLAHVFWGIFTVLYDPYVCTAVFLFKQSIDWLSHKEDVDESMHDVAEFCVGIAVGFIFKYFKLLSIWFGVLV